MSTRPTVLEALRRFLPEFLKTDPPLSPQQRRAIWAVRSCRTPALGGNVFACDCGEKHFAYHSCNHKACPQCGGQATRDWVQRELRKLVNAPYFLVTFTLPAELRGCFFGPFAREAFDLFFTAVSRALSEKLAEDKVLHAVVSGFTAVLHTWNQVLQFHPHIHCLVPGAGLNAKGKYVRVKNHQFLLYLPKLQAAFRQHFYQLFKQHGWQVDPTVWAKEWGVHIRPAGSGAPAVKYLGTYVARTAINDSRILQVTDTSVTFRWKDRSDHNRWESKELTGVEFVERYFRHVLPKGLRSVRYYGFCHPMAQANRLRVKVHSGNVVNLSASDLGPSPAPPCSAPLCPKCGRTMKLILSVSLWTKTRGPPLRPTATPLASSAA